MGRKHGRKPSEFVDVVVETGVRALLAEMSVTAERARKVMREIAHEVCVQWGRTVLYVPADPFEQRESGHRQR